MPRGTVTDVYPLGLEIASSIWTLVSDPGRALSLTARSCSTGRFRALACRGRGRYCMVRALRLRCFVRVDRERKRLHRNDALSTVIAECDRQRRGDPMQPCQELATLSVKGYGNTPALAGRDRKRNMANNCRAPPRAMAGARGCSVAARRAWGNGWGNERTGNCVAAIPLLRRRPRWRSSTNSPGWYDLAGFSTGRAYRPPTGRSWVGMG